jgi:hypothetical protein
MNSNNLKNDLIERRLKTIAISVTNKDRLIAVKLYLDGVRPSDIARFLCYDRTRIRSTIQHTIRIIDLDMIKNEDIYDALMNLEVIYDFKNDKCTLCNRRIHISDMLKHLLTSHHTYLMSKLNEVLGV